MKNQVNNMDWKEGIKYVANNSVDIVITDPPYGMNYKSNARKVNPHEKIANDDNLDWLPEFVFQLKRVTKEDAHLYIFCSWHNIDIFKQEFAKRFNIKNILIWKKDGGGMGDLDGDYAPSYEMILFISNGKKKLNGRRDSNVLENQKTGNTWHPTQKPVALIAYLLEKSSEPDELALDPFAGSHPLAQACVEKSRNYITFEINADYCAIAERLLQGVSGSLF